MSGGVSPGSDQIQKAVHVSSLMQAKQIRIVLVNATKATAIIFLPVHCAWIQNLKKLVVSSLDNASPSF